AVVSPGEPDNLRSSPSLTSSIVARLAAGTQLKIIGGPTCADGYLWWQVQQLDGSEGWIAEGHGSDYYLLPFAAPVAKQNLTFTLPDNASSMPITLDGISFTYDGFAGPAVDVQHSLDYWNYMDTWVESYQFHFGGDQSVVSDLIVVKNGGQFFGQSAMTDLAHQFKTHPALPSNKPIDFIRWGLNAVQLLHAQEKYLTFQNVAGLRFITEYIQNFVAIDGKHLRYEFFGVSSDDRAYISARFDGWTDM